MRLDSPALERLVYPRGRRAFPFGAGYADDFPWTVVKKYFSLRRDFA